MSETADNVIEPIVFTLIIVSPSVGVAGPLTFSQISANVSVKELKSKIRDALPSKPSDDSQRLIHRGRMLSRETETLSDIFGQETLRTSQSQTLHLVLRPPALDSFSSVASAPSLLEEGQGQNGSNPEPTVVPVPIPSPPTQNSGPVLPHPPGQFLSPMAQRLQQLHNDIDRMQQEMLSIRTRQFPQNGTPTDTRAAQNLPQSLQPPRGFSDSTIPANVTALINQQQRQRAADGRQGVQDPNIRTTILNQPNPGLTRPDHTNTYTREGVGPNGERWQVTVNETTTTIPISSVRSHHTTQNQQPGFPHHGPVANLQAILQNADRRMTAHNLQNNTERAPPQIASTGSSSTIGPNSSAAGSGSASMPLNQTPAHVQGTPDSNTASSTQTANTSTPPTTVYVLTSPEGPRALLLHNSSVFFTPQAQSQPLYAQSWPQPLAAVRGAARPAAVPEVPNRRARRHGNPNRGIPLNPQQQNNANDPQLNPNGGAMVAQFWPTVWLIARLVFFIWIFAGGNTSWTRWFLISGLAVLFLMVQLGLFDGVAENYWGPIRRHLEALIPLAGPDAALVPAANAAILQAPPAANVRPNESANATRSEPDPAQLAARLLEEHRARQANRGLLAHIRRIEHSLLLFLASLVPGVGERHIAAREAEANQAEAERLRATAEAARIAEEQVTEVVDNRAHENNEAGVNASNTEDAVAPEEPLIEV